MLHNGTDGAAACFLFFVSLIFLLLRFVRRFLNMVQFDFTFFLSSF